MCHAFRNILDDMLSRTNDCFSDMFEPVNVSVNRKRIQESSCSGSIRYFLLWVKIKQIKYCINHSSSVIQDVSMDVQANVLYTSIPAYYTTCTTPTPSSQTSTTNGTLTDCAPTPSSKRHCNAPRAWHHNTTLKHPPPPLGAPNGPHFWPVCVSVKIPPPAAVWSPCRPCRLLPAGDMVSPAPKAMMRRYQRISAGLHGSLVST